MYLYGAQRRKQSGTHSAFRLELCRFQPIDERRRRPGWLQKIAFFPPKRILFLSCLGGDMVDKRKLSDRLASIKVVDSVLPFRRVDPKLVGGIIEGLKSERYDRADVAMRGILSESRVSSVAEGDAFERLASIKGLSEQLIGFAFAGFGFFRGSSSYVSMSMRERSAIGGNSAVTRVLLSGERLLLETQRINIRFNDGTSQRNREELLKSFDLIPIRSLQFASGLVHAVSDSLFAHDAAMKLLGSDMVEHVAPDFIEFFGQRHIPNDPDYGRQWHHKNIQAEGAWDSTRGRGVRIAIVDNGFDTNHRDLEFVESSAWYRSTPDVADADFVGTISGMPNFDHGTACAGMAVARSGTGIGGCGVAFEAELMAVACLGDQVGTQTSLARAIAYAADPSTEESSELGSGEGADIISCSLGPNGASWAMQPVLEDAIDYAVTKGRGGRGTAIFWATTNGNYPIRADAVSSHPSVIAVGRSTVTDSDDGSGFGPELAFVAPGVDVYISGGGAYGLATGTSFACPCAAAIGGLILATNKDLTASDVAHILRATCDQVGNLPYQGAGRGRNDRFGHGRVNAELAIHMARSYTHAPPTGLPGV
jgi:hypothetical protein